MCLSVLSVFPWCNDGVAWRYEAAPGMPFVLLLFYLFPLIALFIYSLTRLGCTPRLAPVVSSLRWL